MKWWKRMKQKKEAIPHRIAPIPQIRDLRFTNIQAFACGFTCTAQLRAGKLLFREIEARNIRCKSKDLQLKTGVSDLPVRL